MRPQKIVVGLSGGVDSSVTAHLLKQQGYDVLGVFMQNWEDDNNDEYCSIKQDAMDAMAVADILNIDIEIVNFAAQYKDKVFAYFLNEYRAGRTPNPDVLCNAEIKFKSFLEYALSQGAGSIATGHYARIGQENGRYFLRKGIDETKDQTYIHWTLSQENLARTLFPLGELTKPQVRRIALEQGYEKLSQKGESQEICFILNVDRFKKEKIIYI